MSADLSLVSLPPSDPVVPLVDRRPRDNLLFELDRLQGEVVRLQGEAHQSRANAQAADNWRKEAARLEQERDDADGYIRALWRRDLLPQPMPDRLFDRLTK